MNIENNKILFFDGICNLCTGSVKFILSQDALGQIRFSSLQSEFARSFLESRGYDPYRVRSVLYFVDDRIYEKSDAALHVVKDLQQPWRSFRFFKYIPKGIRDAIYTWIADHRYSIFGQRESCYFPSTDIRWRFLE